MDLKDGPRPVGLLRSHSSRQRAETVTFEYDPAWLAGDGGFALDPGLPLTPGIFEVTRRGRLSGALGDSAPDTWGRQLMQRAARLRVRNAGRRTRTLQEVDYLLGVLDDVRLGALRFRATGERRFLAHGVDAVPGLLDIRRMAAIIGRLLRDEETEEDLRLILAPGSSLGGARPKAAVLDREGRLAMAKFPRETDEYSLETWEEVALRLAERAGIPTPRHELLRFAGRSVLLSRRFDRLANARIPFVSAMSLTGSMDGEPGSYPEIADEIARHGADARADAAALYRRMVFNVLVSNVDDHLRNHGFLRLDEKGWRLSPAYDLNPTPTDVKARVLSTRIDLDDGTCSLDLALGTARYFGLSPTAARRITREVGTAVRGWREVALAVGAAPAEIDRMASAFEHDDLKEALAIRV